MYWDFPAVKERGACLAVLFCSSECEGYEDGWKLAVLEAFWGKNSLSGATGWETLPSYLLDGGWMIIVLGLLCP